MLTIKQSSTEQDWADEWYGATRTHSFAEITRLREQTENVIRAIFDEQTIVGYSGGKDSLVLRDMVEHCIDRPVFISCILQNEFPSFEKWLIETANPNTAFVQDNRLSLEWLNSRLEYLFPHGKKEKDIYVQTWRAPTHSYMLKNGYDKIMTGKRVSDGNFCGKLNVWGCKTTEIKNPHIVSLNPMADWTHSQLLAYIQYYKIELPEIYYYPNGFRFGTHPWTERRRLNMSYYDTFDEIMKLDSSILMNARSRLDIVERYFDYNDHGGIRE